MTGVAERNSIYETEFSRLEDGSVPAWLRDRRQQAFERFLALGFPDTRQEDWRFTSVAPIENVDFALARGEGKVPSAAELAPHGFELSRCVQLVFVNGVYRPELSRGTNPPGKKKIRIAPLETLLESDADLLEEHLGRHAGQEEHPFIALNTAFLGLGAGILISPNTVVEDPIHLLYVSTKSPLPAVSHPRNLIVVGENSEARVIESHVGLGGGVSFTNVVTEVVVGHGGRLEIDKIQREGLESFHISHAHAHLSRSAALTSNSFAFGASLSRSNIHAVLDGEGIECTLNGLYVVSGTQHVDNQTLVDHAKPNCNSYEVYKGILDHRARGVFNGKIFVRREAQKTDAKQTNKNLLLSEEALVHTKPQLEIYADDVKCTHGATIGQLDADALFYLRARGIGLQAARSLLTFAFANDIIERVRINEVRAALECHLFTHLPDGVQSGGGA